jgi:hypothetical protein
MKPYPSFIDSFYIQSDFFRIVKVNQFLQYYPWQVEDVNTLQVYWNVDPTIDNGELAKSVDHLPIALPNDFPGRSTPHLNLEYCKYSLYRVQV